MPLDQKQQTMLKEMTGIINRLLDQEQATVVDTQFMDAETICIYLIKFLANIDVQVRIEYRDTDDSYTIYL